MVRSIVCLLFLLLLLAVAFASAFLLSFAVNQDFSASRTIPLPERIDPLPAPDKSVFPRESLHYAVAVDCGSSGSRLFVYVWPPQEQKTDLIKIRELKGLLESFTLYVLKTNDSKVVYSIDLTVK